MELTTSCKQKVQAGRILATITVVSLLATTVWSQNVVSVNTGFSMKVQMNNQGVMGRQAYPNGNPTVASGLLGVEYPAGQPYEHLFGSGIWIGGKLDTARVGTSPQVRGVSFAYEGWVAPLNEFFPGGSPADTIWRGRKGTAKPNGWDQYWGTTQYKPIADDERYMKYNDYTRRITGHVPLNLEVYQRSYVFNDPYAEAIMLLEFTIFNRGTKNIDSTYVGFFFEADVGPNAVANYAQRNFTGYFQNSRTAYVHNPSDRGSTPIGCALLKTSSRSLDSLRYAFRWFPGPQTPVGDAAKYQMLSSNIINPDEFPQLSDSRFVFSFGPFTLRPFAQTRDSLTIAVAVVSGYDPAGNHLRIMQRNASRALDIYLNQGIRLPPTPPSPPLRATVGFRKIHLNWRWTPQDSVGPTGRPNPETTWDSTNQVARRYPDRITNSPPGYDCSRGGRNFEAYKLWRSEFPVSASRPIPPDDSFTLIKQVDVPTDSFEYNTGLEYEFIDSNLVRGKVYTYSVTSKSIPNLVEQQIVIGGVVRTVEVPVDPLESGKFIRDATTGKIESNVISLSIPFSVSEKVGQVAVVPNPYRTDKNYTFESGGYEGLNTEWDENQRKVKFINLPVKCTIKIFSLAGDLVRTVDHDGGAGGFPVGDREVPLVSESNRALASGIYIFTVESSLGLQTGKFVIIR